MVKSNVFITPERLKDLIIKYVKEEERSISSLSRRLEEEGYKMHRLVLTGYLKARGHMSYSTLQLFFNDIMDLDVSQGYLAKICTKKLTPVLQPAYAEVTEFIRNAPIVGTDETPYSLA